MKLIVSLKRELRMAMIPIPSIKELVDQVSGVLIKDGTRAIVEIPTEKVEELKKLASQYYHIEEEIIHHLC